MKNARRIVLMTTLPLLAAPSTFGAPAAALLGVPAARLVGPIQLIRSALPHLRAQGGGRIIQVSSYGGQ